MSFFKVEKETHILPIELAEDGRVRREAEGPGLRITFGRCFIIIGWMRVIR